MGLNVSPLLNEFLFLF